MTCIEQKIKGSAGARMKVRTENARARVELIDGGTRDLGASELTALIDAVDLLGGYGEWIALTGKRNEQYFVRLKGDRFSAVVSDIQDDSHTVKWDKAKQVFEDAAAELEKEATPTS